MFDIGFWELAVLAVIGIVVVGPDKLPEVVRTIAVTLRKLRRIFSDVKADIEHELDLDDMRKILHEADMKAHMDEINNNIMALDKEVRSTGEEAKKILHDIDHETNLSVDDGFTPETAEAEKDTGEEAPPVLTPHCNANSSPNKPTDSA